VAREPLAFPSGRNARAHAARHAKQSRRAERAAARAHHASPRGESFGRLVGFTTLGALVPGSSLVAAGARRTGWVLVTVFSLAVVALVVAVATGRATDIGLQVATRPDALLAVAIAVLAVAVLWCTVVLVGHLLLRRGRLSPAQRVLSGVLVAALMGLIALPSATAARYAMTQRSLILTVFDEPEEDEEEREDHLASPDVEAPDPWADTPRINVLLLGSDAGASRTGTRPDTVIVASIDTQSGNTVLFSLPRNLEHVPFPEGTPAAEQFPNGFWCPDHGCMLNGIWSWAEANPQLFPGTTRPGLSATRAAVGEALGLQIDYYAQVNLEGFAEVINALGGIEITVERRLPIGGGTNELTGRSNPVTGYIEPGRQLLDGYHALWYARSREGSTDYDRMERQRCVLAAVTEQAEPVRLARAFPRLAASAERNVETDIRRSELPAFVELAQRVQSGTLRSLPFTRDVIVPEDPDFAAIQALVQEAIAPPEPEPTASTPRRSPSPLPTLTAEAPSEEPAGPDPQEAVDVDEVCG
jgi:polyisoprenyl-teichoic acid--peptidoglycan teichoic acid transferase